MVQQQESLAGFQLKIRTHLIEMIKVCPKSMACYASVALVNEIESLKWKYEIQ